MPCAALFGIAIAQELLSLVQKVTFDTVPMQCSEVLKYLIIYCLCPSYRQSQRHHCLWVVHQSVHSCMHMHTCVPMYMLACIYQDVGSL